MLYPNDEYFKTEHLKSGIKKRFISSANITFLSQLLSSAINFVGAIILARLIAPEYFGLLSMTSTVILLLQNFGVNGFTEAIIQKEDISHQNVSSLFWINIVISFGLTVLVILLSPLIASFYNDDRLIPIINIMSISILMGGLSTQHTALLARNMKFTRLAVINLASAIISVLFGIILAQQDFGYWALIARRLSIPTVVALGSWLFCTWFPGRPKFGKQVKELVIFGFFTYGNFLLNYLRRNVDKILVGRTLGSEPLGHYDRAYHLSNVIPTNITAPISRVVISTLSRLADNPARFKRFLERLLSTLAFLCFPMSMVLTVTGNDLIMLLLGNQWGEAGVLLSVLGPGVGMLVIYNTHTWVHLSLGNANRLFRWGIYSLIITILLFIVGIQYGTVGVAAAYSSSFYILIIPALWYAGSPIKIPYSFYVNCLWRYFISAVISGILTHQMVFHWSTTHLLFADTSLIIRILSVSICASLLYLFFVILLFLSFRPITDFLALLLELAPDRITNRFKANKS